MSANLFGATEGMARAREEAELTPAHFAAWLRTTNVDVRRLAAHLDHVLSIATP